MPGLHFRGHRHLGQRRRPRRTELGIAISLSTLGFKGTATAAPLDVVEAIENVGGYISALPRAM